MTHATTMIPRRDPWPRAVKAMRNASLWVAVALTAGIGAALLMLFAQAGSADIAGLLRSAYPRRVLEFTLLQAGLSTLISIGLGVPVARAFAREGAFPGRRLLLGLMSLPIVLPSLVAVFGIVAIYGQRGVLSDAELTRFRGALVRDLTGAA